jgi:hypothetical protein
LRRQGFSSSFFLPLFCHQKQNEDRLEGSSVIG